MESVHYILVIFNPPLPHQVQPAETSILYPAPIDNEVYMCLYVCPWACVCACVCVCDCLVNWFGYELFAKPGNKDVVPPWPDSFIGDPISVIRVPADVLWC